MIKQRQKENKMKIVWTIWLCCFTTLSLGLGYNLFLMSFKWEAYSKAWAIGVGFVWLGIGCCSALCLAVLIDTFIEDNR